MADPSEEKRENPSPKVISCFSLAAKENEDVDTETKSPMKLADFETSGKSTKRGHKCDKLQNVCRKIYGDIAKLSYTRIHSATYKRRIDNYLGKILAKMPRTHLIEFGKLKVLKELKNKLEIERMISRQAQLCKTLKTYKQQNQILKNKTRNGAPSDMTAMDCNDELEFKDEADNLKIDVDHRAADNTVFLPGDPLNPTVPDKSNSDGEALSEEYCFIELCKSPEQTNIKEVKETDRCLNPRVVLTDINKLLEKKDKSFTIKRVFEKKWTVLNLEVPKEDNYFHQIQRITSLKMKLWQRYLRNSGNVYYYEKLRKPILKIVRASTKVTVPKDTLSGKCGYFEHCNRVYAFKLFYGHPVRESGVLTAPEQITQELESEVLSCKPNFEKKWTARIPAVAPKDNYFDRIQKIEPLKLNTCERYLKIDGKLYYFEKLQNPLQERVRYSTVMAPAKDALEGRCGYFRHGRNGLYMFKLIDETLTDEHITRVVNTSKVVTRLRNCKANEMDISSNNDSATSRTNCRKIKKSHTKPAVVVSESIFDIFGTNDPEFVDVSFKSNRKRKHSESDYTKTGYTESSESPEELCWEIPTTEGEAVRIIAKKKCPKFDLIDFKSALKDSTSLSVNSSLNIRLHNANNVISPTSLPPNSNNVISLTKSPPHSVISARKTPPHNASNVFSPRTTLIHSVNNVISPRSTPPHNINNAISPRSVLPQNVNNVITPKRILSHNSNNVISPTETLSRNANNVISPTETLSRNANNVVSTTKASGINVLKRVLIVKSRKNLQMNEFPNSSKKTSSNVVGLISTAQNENWVSGSVSSTPKQIYSRRTSDNLNLNFNMVVPPLVEGPPCRSVVKVNKTGQQCIVKKRPSDLNISYIRA